MVLVTGPTGSGKTVTLYSALNLLNTVEKNISTVEDPVEINLRGINQVNINAKIGLDFATTLRSLLRQDPDIIMVGEIRDIETAEIAIKAAQTGHLVFSTIHTNNAAETIVRLINLGIAPYNINSAITLIMAQRLARRLCNFCKSPQIIPEEILLNEGLTAEEINNVKLFTANGCEHCTKGYKGRVGIFELLPITAELNEIIRQQNIMAIQTYMKKAELPALRISALKKVKQGITSLAEINRVINNL